jgi:uncharacterized UBP type Zn finger protein
MISFIINNVNSFFKNMYCFYQLRGTEGPLKQCKECFPSECNKECDWYLPLNPLEDYYKIKREMELDNY